jgi:hypothetical protein
MISAPRLITITIIRMDLPELDVVLLRLDIVFLLLDLITGNKLVKYGGRFLNISCKKAVYIVEPIKQELKLMAVRTSTGTILSDRKRRIIKEA